MDTSPFHKLSRLLWAAAVVLVVVLAMYVSLGRYLMSNIGAYQPVILDQLNARLPFAVNAAQVRGEWRNFNPVLVLTELELSFADPDVPPIVLDEGRFILDTWETVTSRQLTGNRIQLQGLQLEGSLDQDGRFSIAGFGSGGGQFRDWFEAFVRNVEDLTLVDNRLDLALPEGERRELTLDMHLRRSGSQRLLNAELVGTTTGTRIGVQAEGLGNPFNLDTYTGELYLDIDFAELASLGRFLPVELPMRAAGTGALEVWVSWASGAPTVEVALSASDVSLRSVNAGSDWQVPLQTLSMVATLEEQRDQWRVFAEDLKLQKDGVVLRLPRLQADLRGDSLRLRAARVELEPLNSLLTGLSATPDQLGDVFTTLNPRGRLQRAEFTIEDLSTPAASWELRTRFDGVAVDSWKGAPGVSGAKGYAELRPRTGFVSLDSQPLAMDFPTVYREPLAYNDFAGTIYIDWDSEALELSSSLVAATGVEGTAHALFGLRVPFQPVPEGIEMDLLVGLQDSHPIHRNKYIPYILNDTLVDWLRGSIGEGRIRDSAFLWRGSLSRGAAPYRTVQLGFNVSDTALSYHDQWPGLDGLAGIVLVDDTNVSVWSEQARLFDSGVEFLSAEAWMDGAGQMQLVLDARVVGAAADALAVVNNSPLSPLVGNAFADWQLNGELATSLQLGMNLNRPKDPPQVAVQARLTDAGLLIEPGRLPVSGISGDIGFTTENGFSSSDLVGSLWDEPLSARIYQAGTDSEDGEQEQGAAAVLRSPVAVDVTTAVDMADVGEWLSLPQLGFARGRSPVELELRVPPGGTPVLSASSQLQGVALQLPAPWTKPAESARALTLELPLSRDQLVLALALEDELTLALDITGGGFNSGALLVSDGAVPDPNQPPPAAALPTLAPQRLTVTGSAALVDADAWLEFIDKNFLAGTVEPQPSAPLVTPTMPVADAGNDDPNTPGAAGMADFRVVVDRLYAQELQLWKRGFSDVVFSLDVGAGGWRVDAANDWLDTTITLDTATNTGAARFAEFDVSGLAELALEPAKQASAQAPITLPSLAVTVDRLSREGADLGELQFRLRSDGDTVLAERIEGSVAGLRFDPGQPGAMAWQQGEEEGTRFQAALAFDDLGDTFDRLGYQRIIETERGNAAIELEWPGGPQDFGIASSLGSVTVATEEGRFLEASAGTSGALRVVSILNLADIVRRLSLTHMFESGIPFEELTSEAFFHAGTVEIPNMVVSGAGSGFQFGGLSNLDAGTIDGELVVTLPVANNLPWVAALAAGPAVAAGVFVVSRVFEDQVNRFSSGVYKVSGPLDEPEVTFDRIFDDSGSATVEPVAEGLPNDAERTMGFEPPAPADTEPNQPPP